MKVKGIIKVKTNIEEINFIVDCSKNTFIELATELYDKTGIMIQSMYFDEGLTDEEFKILMSSELPTKEDDTKYWVDLINWESGGIEEVSNTNLIQFKKDIDVEIQKRLKQ